MNRSTSLAWLLAGAWVVGAGVTVARDARACGGCFHEPAPPTQVVGSVVTAHRMAFSISPAQTVLWDQIQYSGTPSAFAWVLPVKPGAVIELSQDAWIASLDAATQTVIQGPAETCGGPSSREYESGGGGCGSSSASGADFAAGGASPTTNGTPAVTVVTQQVVGPYDAVTVRSSRGEALGDWLRANGYEVPESMQPTIDAFTSEGFDFIALKLAPGEGVQAMQPVRVITAGADLSLPLRMVAAGIGAHVGIELFVLSEGRYHPQDFPDATIDFTRLAWNPNADVSNYTTLAAQALAANGGRGWLTESAGPANLGASSDGVNPPLDTTYQSTCAPQVLAPPASCGESEGGATDDGGDADADGAAGSDASACAGQTIGCDDLDLAMTGIAAGDLWITRLRADLPASALSDDLVLEASPSQDPMPSFHQTSAYTISGYDPCTGSSSTSTAGCSGSGASSANASAGCGCRTAESPATRYLDAVLLLGASIAAAGALRRRRRGR